MNPYFFVHVPKTAGTSFRLGLEQAVGKERVFYDYGAKSPHTSGQVSELIYQDADFWHFFQSIQSDESPVVIAGHVPVLRFVAGCGVANTMLFLRHPLQRLMSEYQHFVRNNGYEKPFKVFYEGAHNQNRQSKMLHGAPLEAIGLLGITERYGETLEILRSRFGLEIPVREDNQGRNGLGERHVFEGRDESRCRYLNAHDLELYDYALALFDQRRELFMAGKPYVHGKLVRADEQRIAGWAWWGDDSHVPVKVQILINGQVERELSATEFRSELCRLTPPRGGYVGFSMKSSAVLGDRVQCRVVDTGQCFPIVPMIVEAQ
ncbi:sulfotransferase family 2 domain-containing protein [Ectothiorhodospira shaposhnikovii]|uniref:sulfotransferase family 2 domain-containing protein n=1 Tax=Ectothiorhodospira shaposhnikovii TaxID=1054 RepID=UPI001EE8E2CB|nr:sulfotransferase family 2 domain-containing protein [Ectothiorhodospira shaposhnikovii]MCG5513991.1 sulfotransferase family protein [Ectothiorhodospira shaposhnikovii]